MVDFCKFKFYINLLFYFVRISDRRVCVYFYSVSCCTCFNRAGFPSLFYYIHMYKYISQELEYNRTISYLINDPRDTLPFNTFVLFKTENWTPDSTRYVVLKGWKRRIGAIAGKGGFKRGGLTKHPIRNNNKWGRVSVENGIPKFRKWEPRALFARA